MACLDVYLFLAPVFPSGSVGLDDSAGLDLDDVADLHWDDVASLDLDDGTGLDDSACLDDGED